MSQNSFKYWTKAFKKFPCLLITGPKHSQKIQAIQTFLNKPHTHINLVDPEVRATIEKKPEEVISSTKVTVIEEIQHLPQIVYIIKEYLQKNPTKTGKFILSSSASLSSIHSFYQELSGYIAIFPFYPNAWPETPKGKSSPIEIKTNAIPIYNESDLLDTIRLGYSCSVESKRDRYYSTWLQTYMERDLPRIRNIENITDFQFFLKKLVQYNAEPLNMAEVARQLGLSLNTVKAWVSALLDSYVITLIEPSRKSFGLRMRKAPNIYFLDTGLAAYLSEIKDNKSLSKSPLLEGLMKSFVISELYRYYGQKGIRPLLNLWCPTNNNTSVLFLEALSQIFVFDISIQAHHNPSDFINHKSLQEIYHDRLTFYNIHLESSMQMMPPNMHSVPIGWANTW